MYNSDEINEIVHHSYWVDNLNCAATTLKTLASNYSISIAEQVSDSTIGLHGAGKYGAQCGLVEGTLLFIGIYGTHLKLHKRDIVKNCYNFAVEFEKRYSSLLCDTLRPGGFKATDPDHLCESLTSKAIIFSIEFINKNLVKD